MPLKFYVSFKSKFYYLIKNGLQNIFFDILKFFFSTRGNKRYKIYTVYILPCQR